VLAGSLIVFELAQFFALVLNVQNLYIAIYCCCYFIIAACFVNGSESEFTSFGWIRKQNPNLQFMTDDERRS
jgi:hypothetical protein